MIRRLALAVMFAAPALAAQNAAPLAPYAGTKVAVVPVQFYHTDSAGWGEPAGPALRARFDSLLSEALNEHGLSGTWATPAEVIRTARRNVTYAGDPRNLGAFSVRYGTKKETPIADRRRRRELQEANGASTHNTLPLTEPPDLRRPNAQITGKRAKS